MEEEEIKTSEDTPPLQCADLPANALALLGLQEIIRCFWLDVEGLAIVSMLSVRARLSASNDRSWRYAVRAMFPRHPFEIRDRELPSMALSRYALANNAVDNNVPCINGQGDSWVCLDPEHATQLIRWAFTKNFLPKRDNFLRQIWLQAVGAEGDQQAENMKLIQQLSRCKTPLSIGLCVVVDLCRPHLHSATAFIVFNGARRSHSNLPKADPSISSVMNNQNYLTNAWQPRCSSDQTVDEPDFVVIEGMSDVLSAGIVGIAVQASGSVAVRVDKLADSELGPGRSEWVSVAGGALLRPFATSAVRSSASEAWPSVQLIAFPNPKEFSQSPPGHSIRITVVECDGSGFRVGLLAFISSVGTSGSYASYYATGSHSKRLRAFFENDNALMRTKNFAADDDYRTWWYRLQSIRGQMHRVLPVLSEASNAIAEAVKELNGLRLSRTYYESFLSRDKCVKCMLAVLFLIYMPSFLLVVPIFIGVNLDKVTYGKHANANTTADIATMSTPNPDFVLRTLCRQEDMIPWWIVLFPILIAGLCALVLVVMRSIEMIRIFRAKSKFSPIFFSKNEKIDLVHQQTETRVKAVIAEITNVDPAVAASIANLATYYTQARKNQLRSRRGFPFDRPPLKFLACIIIDTSVLLLSVCAAVAYGMGVWWCASVGSEDTSALPIVLGSMCAVADVVLVVLVLSVCRRDRSDPRTKRNQKQLCCIFILSLVLIFVQQLLLLMKVFAFFHEVTFFVVFSPLFVFVILLVVGGCIKEWAIGCLAMVFAVTLIPSIVLLMLKADDIFGVGTALGSDLPDFSWVVVMVPIWLSAVIMPLTYCLMMLGLHDDD